MRGKKLAAVLGRVSIEPALALSALARPAIDFSKQRTTGAYHTDFRLAALVASMAMPRLGSAKKIVDPACGTGMLLTAAVIAASGGDAARSTDFLRNRVVAADRDPVALRGARIALSCLTSDVSALTEMCERFRIWDSLITPVAEWRALAGDGFDVVVANPPWEKIKLSRHEFLRARGHVRHYGHTYDDGAFDLFEFKGEVDSLNAYDAELSARYQLLGPGENDLYKPFMELFISLLGHDGCLSVLVPAGLIRSHGTHPLRKLLFDRAGELEFAISENRANYFSIDTRFKFVAVRALLGHLNGRSAHATVRHLTNEVSDRPPQSAGAARINRKKLAVLRPDLTIPEVRSRDEWRLFEQMYAHGIRLDAADDWKAAVARELDMTRDRRLFAQKGGPGMLPIVEGRMVHQHRFGAKRYLEGTGRRALWQWVQGAKAEVSPQFWIREDRLPVGIRERVHQPRVGFCDITGQTNERSMLASSIPAGVVCGNKVPTLIFEDANPDRVLLWLAIANSFPFDWMLRRTVTTTVNYFLLFSLPFPKLSIKTPLAQRILRTMRQIQSLDIADSSPHDRMWKVGALRAEIDACVAAAFKLEYRDLQLILEDFPLLDRGQPPVGRERRSVVTRDVLLARYARQLCEQNAEVLRKRVAEAKKRGAIPYVPSDAAETLLPQLEREA